MINTIFIELTNRCNCSCKSCPQSIIQRHKGYMDFDVFVKVVDQAWAMSHTINLSFFGEQTTHPRFIECLRYLQKRPQNKNVILFSNFLATTKETITEIIKTNFKKVHISINAATSETYDIVRMGSSCTDLDGNIFSGQNIDRLNILKEKVFYWFERSHPPTRHEFVVTPYTIHETFQFANTWLPLLSKNDEILFKRILSYGGKIFDKFIVNSRCNMFSSGDFLVVSWDGNVSPCFLDNDMLLTIGSVHTSSLKDIYNSNARKQIQNMSATKSIYPCNQCHDASHAIDSIIYRHGDKCSPIDFERFK